MWHFVIDLTNFCLLQYYLILAKYVKQNFGLKQLALIFFFKVQTWVQNMFGALDFNFQQEGDVFCLDGIVEIASACPMPMAVDPSTIVLDDDE